MTSMMMRDASRSTRLDNSLGELPLRQVVVTKEPLARGFGRAGKSDELSLAYRNRARARSCGDKDAAQPRSRRKWIKACKR
jgi:hypothetical protein